MKLLKERFLKRVLVCILSVIILSVSVGDVFIKTNDIRTVRATGVEIGGVAVASLAEICLFVGSIAVTVYCVGEVIDNREEIARFGYDLINSCSETVDGWIMSFTDTAGQEYVYGTEALDLVRETEWEVIQGGLPPENNDDDNNDDKPTKNPMQNLWNLTALGATWLMSNISSLYQKWVNGEELTEAEHAVLAPVIDGYCDQNDIAKQWSGEMFPYSATIDSSYYTDSPVVCTDKYTIDSNMPHCAVYRTEGIWHYFEMYMLNSSGGISSARMDYEQIVYIDSQLTQHQFYTNRSSWFIAVSSGMKNFIMSYSSSFPVFSSRIEAEAYLKGTGAVTDALNYAKTYQNADWLSDDWAGVLIDPLTNIGLTLSQLVDLAKALSLHAVGNNLSPQELADLITQSLPAVNPDLLPGTVPAAPPVPDPDMDPVYWPSADAHPLPGTKPGTDPDPGKDPEPGTDPDEDMSSYKVDLHAIFPFCIPFDFIALLRVLDAEPEAPCFEFPVVIPALGYNETVRLDMAVFDDVAEVMRLCETVSFVIFLMFVTSKVIKW